MRKSANHRSIPSLTVIGRRARLTLIAFLAIGVSLAVLPLIGGPQAAVRKVSRLASHVVETLKAQASPENLASRSAIKPNSQGAQAQQSGFTPSASITVNTLVDENGIGANCSLREAITAANTNAAFGGCPAGSVTDTITFSVTGTITLGSSLPAIASSVNITGPGSGSLTISGNDSVRIITIGDGFTVTISNLTMAHGKALNLQGGAIDSNASVVTLSGMVFDHNFATFDGGAVRNNGGNMMVTNCTFTNNEAAEPFGQGGGLKANGGTTAVTGSTFLNNNADAGGGFHVGNSSTSATVSNSTFFGNTATFGGAVETRASAAFQNCTMSGNIASGDGGIHLLAGSVTLINTIVSGNLDPNGNPRDLDVGGSGTVNLASSFNNLIGTPGGTGLTQGVNGNHVNITNPLLAPLANYGGTTQTMPPLGNSVAINAGNNAGAPATDQRGVARPVGGTVEIGAVEVTFIVNSTGDAVDSNVGNGTCATAGAVCTLRAAIQEVSASAIDNYITFNLASPSTITLGSSLPNITSSVGIAGPGAASLTITGNDNVRIMTIDVGATVAISNLTMAHGKALNLQGGAIDSSGTVTLSGMVFDHNFATFDGGAVRNAGGNMTVTNCTFSNNVANSASGGGGGLRSNGTLVLSGSTFLNNSANGGGAMQLGAGSTSTVTNSTFYGNTGVSGGGIETRGATTFQNCTINGNIENTGAGMRILLGSTTLINTIVSGNNDPGGNPKDIDGAINTAASFNNLIGFPGSSGLTDGVNGNHVNITNPLLAPLGNYGGPTQTMAVLGSSVALNGGKNTGAPATDQRGAARPSGGTVDIGAYEATIAVTPTSIPAGTVGVNYNGSSFSASGETGDFTFSETGTLPNGMSFSTVGANLDGVPTQGGSFPICIQATDTMFGRAGVACYTLVINTPVLDHFAISTIASPKTAGTAFTITITAQDSSNATISGFTGTVNLTTNAGTITPTTSGAFSAGVRSESVTLTQSGTGKTITVDDGSGHTGTSNTFTINPGVLNHFGFANVSTQTAGTAFNISLTAQDLNNNTVTSFSGSVTITTVTGGSISPTTSGAFTSGTRTQSVTLTQAGTGKTITVTDGIGHNGVSNSFTVNAGALHHIAIGNVTSPEIAGTPFGLSLTAQDLNNNTVTSFTGTVALSTTAGTISPTTSGAFTAGFISQAVTVTQAGGGKTISIDDGGGHTATSNGFTVNSGALFQFAISPISTQVAGTAFNITMTAQDTNGNTVTSFASTVNLSTTAGTITPTISGAFTSGTRTQSVTATQAGTGKTISVTDGSGHTATSNTFTVNPGAVNHFGFGNITTQTAGVAFNITMTAQDLNNNTVTSFASTVTLSASGGIIAPTTSGAFTSGVRTESVTMTPASASRTITATDGGGHTGTSNTFAVNDTTPTIVSLSPTSAQLNSTGGTVTITGTNFSATSTIQYNGSLHTSTFVNGTTITVVLAAADTNSAGSKTVNVTNPGPGGGTTASLLFDIDDPSVCGSQSVTVTPGNSGMASGSGGCTSNGVDATLNRNAGAGSNATVYAAAYSSNPTGTSIFNVGGGFVDVKVTTAVGTDSVNAVYYYPNTITGTNETNLKLFFFNVDHWQAVKSSGGVDPVKNTTDNLNGTTSGGTFAVTFNGTSVPTVTQLTGTVFTTSTVSTPTAVDFDSATVTRVGNRALVQWKTGMEINNLGFNVYRQDGGDRAQVNPSLIAGTALMVGGDVRVESGYTYNWIDDNPSSGTSYWIEDVDLSGNSTWHGPFGITASSNKMITRTMSRLLNNINDSVARQANSIIQTEYVANTGNQVTNATISSGVTNGRTPSRVSVPASLQKQWQIASQSAVKIAINKTGWYKVNAADMFAAGLNANASAATLQMFVGGVEVPIKVNSADGIHLDSIEFYGVGLNTPTSDTQVYWLTSGFGYGKRINVQQSPISGNFTSASSFQYTVERKDRSLYFSSLKNGDAENWFGPVVNSNSVSQTINVHNHDANASGQAQIEVALQGVTTNSHSVNVMLNGQAINTMTFDAMDHSVMKLSIPETSLVEGNNQITFAAQNSGDVSLIDYVRITYAHNYVAEDNALAASISGMPIKVSGFTSNQITAIDVANLNQPVEVQGTIGGYAGNYSLSIGPAKSRNLVMFTPDKTLQPSSITGNQPSNLSNASNGADFVIITNKDFAQSVQPLADLRQSQGYQVSVVDVDNIYDEFSFGVHSPYAVRDFLNWTYTHWQKQPQFVMLAGSGTIDPRNYTGLGVMDFVPTKLVDTNSMETASDDWFVDFNSDGKPQMSIGRLPVHTAAEATLVVNKIIAYEHSDKMEGMVLVSDISDNADFNGATNQIRNLIPSNLSVVSITRGQIDTDAKTALLNQLNQGGRIINYAGHGSVNLWRGGLLTDDDMTALANHKTSPLVVTMTCLNGYFQDPKLASLGESLLKVNNGGAVSVWASSGMTDAQSQTTMNHEFFRQLFGNPTITIGQAIKAAKSATDDNDIRRTWILFGDPTMRIK